MRFNSIFSHIVGVVWGTGASFEPCCPIFRSAPFLIMVEYCLVTWYLLLKEMTYRQMLPLTTGLELEKYSRDNRQKVDFTGESSFGNAQMGHNLFFIVSLLSTAYFGNGSVD